MDTAQACGDREDCGLGQAGVLGVTHQSLLSARGKALGAKAAFLPATTFSLIRDILRKQTNLPCPHV